MLAPCARGVGTGSTKFGDALLGRIAGEKSRNVEESIYSDDARQRAGRYN
jgi:hypothetical protein